VAAVGDLLFVVLAPSCVQRRRHEPLLAIAQVGRLAVCPVRLTIRPALPLGPLPARTAWSALVLPGLE
jgi:hypothetical protein